MKEYSIRKIKEKTMELDSPVWDEIKSINVDYYPWKGYFEDIKTSVKLVYSDYGITVHFETDEKPLVMKYTEDNSNIWEDSCMEFFFGTSAGGKFINLEINPNGAVRSEFGNPKPDRNIIIIKKDMFFVKNEITDDKWTLQYVVPFSFFEEYFGECPKVFYGNFYKCGHKTGHEHYACWNPILNKNPNFHMPEFFGKLILE